MKEHPSASIHVVWASMLEGDDEAAARASSKLLDDPRVHQYWDPQRRSGIAYVRDLYPNIRRDMAQSLPDDEEMLAGLKNPKDLPPERIPLWDVAFFYEKGATWGDHPPRPKWWSKQAVYYGTQGDGLTGRFWRDDYVKPPFDSDWFVEISRGMNKLTGKVQKTGRAKSNSTSQENAMRERGAIVIQGEEESKNSDVGASLDTSNDAPKKDADVTAMVESLGDSLDPLRDHFNANKSKKRFVALLSPT